MMTPEQLAESEAKQQKELTGKAKAEFEKTKKRLNNTDKLVSDLSGDFFYVAQDQLFYWRYNGKWHTFSEPAFKSAYFEVMFVDGSWDMFRVALEHAGMSKRSCSATFGETPPNTFNIKSREDWLLPAERGKTTADTIWFELMLKALTRHEDARKHLLEVIGWAYLYPWDSWRLPCLNVYGAGGAGKNLLFETIGKVIFKQHLVKVTNINKSKFNKRWSEAALLFLDEKDLDKGGENTLKMIIGSPELEFEGKYANPVQGPNEMLVALATNNNTGAIRIDHDGSTQRRFSFIEVNKAMKQVVSDHFKCEEAEADELIKRVCNRVCRDPEEVSIFLRWCVDAAEKLEAPPGPLLGRDYAKAMSAQEDVVDELSDAIFIEDPDFSHVTLRDFHHRYVDEIKLSNPGQAPMSDRKIRDRVESFIKRHKLNIELVKQRVNEAGGPAKRLVIYSVDKFPTVPPIFKDTATYYRDRKYLKLAGIEPFGTKLAQYQL